MKRGVGLAVMLLVVAAVSGYWWHLAHARPKPLGVVLISLDTTRADRLSTYGFMDASMPALDRLAREGAWFDQAITVAPLTLPAHTSLMTGLTLPHHGVKDNADPPLSDDHTTLAEALKVHGFHTAAFVGSAVLGPDRGLQQGFDRYSATGLTEATNFKGQRRGDEVIAEAIQWLEQAKSPFFVWAHLYDAHRPYDPPPPFQSIADPYVGEIEFADSQVGRLLDALARLELLDRTIVIVTGDHGESLAEHGERDHGIFLYDSVLRIPLIMRVPGVAPSRIGNVVRIIDVAPTILDLFGLPALPTDGVSLVGLITGQRPSTNLSAYSESWYPQRFGWSPLRALREGRFKLIDAPRPELYDLERDPFEQQNLYNEQRALAEAMTARARALASLSPRGGTNQPVSEELRERLQSLGYVGTPAIQPSSPDEVLPDPKDCIRAHPDLGDSDFPAPAQIFPCAGHEPAKPEPATPGK